MGDTGELRIPRILRKIALRPWDQDDSLIWRYSLSVTLKVDETSSHPWRRYWRAQFNIFPCLRPDSGHSLHHQGWQYERLILGDGQFKFEDPMQRILFLLGRLATLGRFA
jgi:hypothetical protein